MMKKSIIITVAASLLCSGAFALNPIKFGLKAGFSSRSVNLGNASAGQFALSAHTKGGFQIGGMARVTLPKFTIQPELNFSRNRYELTGASASSSSTSVVSLNSLEIPVLARISIVKFLFAEAGPVFNVWNDSSNTRAKSNTQGVTAPAHAIMYDRASVGFTAGLSADVGPLTVSGRYNGDFKRPVQAITIGEQTAEVKTRMHTWLLSVGFFF